jgi:hypothetical protein
MAAKAAVARENEVPVGEPTQHDTQKQLHQLGWRFVRPTAAAECAQEIGDGSASGSKYGSHDEQGLRELHRTIRVRQVR